MIQIISWLNPPGPKVVVSYYRGKVNLPKKNEDALGRLRRTMLPGDRSSLYLTEIEKLDKKKISKGEDLSDINLADDLRLLTEYKDYWSPFSLPSAYFVRVENQGSQPATNVAVVFPEKGLAEIQHPGSATSWLETEGRVSIPSLQPGLEVKITHWVSFVSPWEVKTFHDGGTATMREVISTDIHGWATQYRYLIGANIDIWSMGLGIA